MGLCEAWEHGNYAKQMWYIFNVLEFYQKMHLYCMFQIGVSFYLLYTQVGLAFLAGAVFTILLIPINKYIASKIGKSFFTLAAKF
jgi:hypothetical protein